VKRASKDANAIETCCIAFLYSHSVFLHALEEVIVHGPVLANVAIIEMPWQYIKCFVSVGLLGE
jgi:hypothetical protein